MGRLPLRHWTTSINNYFDTIACPIKSELSTRAGDVTDSIIYSSATISLREFHSPAAQHGFLPAAG